MTALIDNLLEFVRHDLLHGRDVEVDADTSLFEQGMVDSLGILRLIAFLEIQIDRPIADAEVVMEHFRTIRTIDRRFGGENGNRGA
ncbi:MAG TPA: acyl carrier protein [Vicinamibacterales bacterium]|nr:acyl carrier protein [Vicinamibacterales bacterium]